MNVQQRHPYPSSEISGNPKEASLIFSIFEDLFEYVRRLVRIFLSCLLFPSAASQSMLQLQKILPKEYEILAVYCDHLPLNDRPPSYPFAGFTVNISVATSGHRDDNDKILCIVMAFGCWEGGELCFYEAGQVFKLKPGDVIIFPSGDITHFNLHFKGMRASLVWHSDKEGDKWVEDQNGWVLRWREKS